MQRVQLLQAIASSTTRCPTDDSVTDVTITECTVVCDSLRAVTVVQCDYDCDGGLRKSSSGKTAGSYQAKHALIFYFGPVCNHASDVACQVSHVTLHSSCCRRCGVAEMCNSDIRNIVRGSVA